MIVKVKKNYDLEMLNKRLTHGNIIVFLIVRLVFLHIMKSQMTFQVDLALESFITNLTSVNHLEIIITQQTGLGEIISLTSLQMFQQLVLLPKLAATKATLVF